VAVPGLSVLGEPSGFRGRKAISNHASALVTRLVPNMSTDNPRTLSNTPYLPPLPRSIVTVSVNLSARHVPSRPVARPGRPPEQLSETYSLFLFSHCATIVFFLLSPSHCATIVFLLFFFFFFLLVTVRLYFFFFFFFSQSLCDYSLFLFCFSLPVRRCASVFS